MMNYMPITLIINVLLICLHHSPCDCRLKLIYTMPQYHRFILGTAAAACHRSGREVIAPQVC
jgi:hypothetical protein